MFESSREFWNGLNKTARVGFVAGSIAILVMVALFAYWVVKDNYQVLFAQLDPQDAAAIVNELERAKVSYKLAEGGTKILVDEDLVHKMRLKLMGKGVPLRGGVGFEIFDHNDFGMTEFAQKINFQRALQGELARTIMAFDEVKFARVHLVMPESSIFKQTKSPTKASVSLLMKGDAHLSPEQIGGIQRLVAAAVPGLEAEHVTILDQRGMALTRNSEADAGQGVMNSRLEPKKEIENYLTRKVIDVLDRTFGPGQAIVSVDVTLNLDQVKSTLEDVIPLSTRDGEATGVVARRKQSVQGFSAPRTVQTSETDSPYAVNKTVNTVTEVEYQLSRKVEQVVSTPGSIRRLSVGVLIPQNLDEEKLRKLREVIGMTVGLNANRGDAIALHSVEQFIQQKDGGIQKYSADHDAPFDADKTIDKTINEKQNPWAGRLRNSFWIVGLIVGIGFIVVFITLLNQRNKNNTKRNLTPKEREEILSQIKQWVGLENKALDGGKK
ncbi:MAG TPA: flagellar basal-body MS-ring/collar protein FliF [Acidiferrobacterales bacterium]|nr:flagellar basal-body MS-ring/collar protein FliF [Acidiferrobacterales bacterium]